MLSDDQTLAGEPFLDEVVDPRGEVLEPTVSAPQPASLAGAALGLLDNTKWNAASLLGAIGSDIAHRVSLGSVKTYRKDTWGQPADPLLIDKIAAECDVVITASGD